MALNHIIILALVQGATEFLPISSSGHLTLVHALSALPDHGVRLDIALHSGTLLAVIVYFWRDIVAMLKGVPHIIGNRTSREAHLTTIVMIASVPAMIIGGILFTSGAISYLRTAEIVAWANIIFALPLWAADKWGGDTTRLAHLPYRAALLIGIAQICAFIPGASRAGVTIMAARALHIPRPEAARYSMLLSVPLIAAFATAQIIDLAANFSAHQTIDPTLVSTLIWDIFIASILTALIALASIHIFMKLIQKFSLAPFILYRLTLGIALLAILYI
ncbi:MAG: undecaprenyl-diphosphate phosphatase [Alphaproteobacteria bacterium]|nr:undecaprenyl-diphosphate phosphatase [Alphaproteobacteria bacterium]